MFSQGAIEYLEANDYKIITQGEGFTITHSAASRVSLVVFGILTGIGSLFLILLSPLIGMLALVGTILLCRIMINRAKGKSTLKVNTVDQSFVLYDQEVGYLMGAFDYIDEIGITSRFIQSYASAGKSTNEEYLHAIFIRLANSQEVEIFQFQGDYLEPPKEFHEIHDSLKNLFSTP